MKFQKIRLAVTDSTNRAVRDLAKEGAPQGTVVLAEEQTAGVGRMGRSFFSPKGSGLYFSLLLRPDTKGFDASRVTVAAAVAVAEAVEQVLGLSLSVKWVNDLYFRGKKVCGILAQGGTDGKDFYCVLGIGLNVFAPREGFGVLDSIAGALLDTPPCQEQKIALEDAVLERFSYWYQGEFSACIREYRRRCFLIGKVVTVVQGDRRFRGEVCGIGEGGELLVAEGEQTHAFSSGEIGLEDYR